MVVAVMVEDLHAHAWAFDRGTLVGCPLPPPAEIATAVERITAYAAQQDREGVQRAAENLMPAIPARPTITLMAGAVALAVLIVVGVAALRRSSIP